MSDLAGKIRVPYKNTYALKKAMKDEFDRNPYVRRFQRMSFGKRKQKIAIAMTHQLDGGRKVKKGDLVLVLPSKFDRKCRHALYWFSVTSLGRSGWLSRDVRASNSRTASASPAA